MLPCVLHQGLSIYCKIKDLQRNPQPNKGKADNKKQGGMAERESSTYRCKVIDITI